MRQRQSIEECLPNLVSVEEVAERISGDPKRLVRQWKRTGEVRVHKIGNGDYRVDPDDVALWLEGRRVPTPAERKTQATVIRRRAFGA